MLAIENVLSAEDVARVRQDLAEVTFIDGRRTAGARARQVKENEQASHKDAGTQALEKFVREAILRSNVLKAYARPARWSRIIFSRYVPGMAYGRHVDDAMMAVGQDGERIRTDLAYTLFLADPESYEGGALVSEDLDGDRAVKLPAGSMVVYEASTIHQVEPVTKGERVAAVGWVQSVIRDPIERQILFDLSRVKAGFAREAPEAPERLLLDKAISNLIRRWGQP